MKKIFFLLILVLSSLLLSGCTIAKKEILTCDKASDSGGFLHKETHDLTFMGSRITKYQFIIRFDLSDYATDEEVFDKMVKQLRVEYSKAIERGVTTDVYPEGSDVVVIFSFDSNLFDGILDYNNYDFTKVFNSNVTIAKLKPKLEENGYTCSVE